MAWHPQKSAEGSFGFTYDIEKHETPNTPENKQAKSVLWQKLQRKMPFHLDVPFQGF